MAFLAAIAGFTACSKDENLANNGEMYTLNINPYAYVGETHNDVILKVGNNLQDSLDYYAQIASKSQNDYARIQNLVKGEMCEVMVGEYPEIWSNINDIDTFYSSSFDALMEDTTVSPALFGKVETLLESSNTVNDLILSIDSAVRAIRADESSDTITKVQELVALSVMSSSIRFWSDAIENTENPWHNYVCSEYGFAAGAKEGWFKKLVKKIVNGVREHGGEVAAADVCGAVVGGAFGASTGNVSIIATCAVSGAIVQSVRAAVRKQ